MRGEELTQATIRFGGVEGDRLFAFRSSASPAEFPYFTAREQPAMLRYRARLRGADQAEIETPAAGKYAIDDPTLIQLLRRGVDAKHELSLMHAAHALADAFPISIFAVQTARQLAAESDTIEEKRRFRANIYVDLPSRRGFAENDFVGRSLRIGQDVIVAVRKRDVRCAMITLHPDTCARSASLLKAVVQRHDGSAGVYGEVLAEGTVRSGDPIVFVG